MLQQRALDLKSVHFESTKLHLFYLYMFMFQLFVTHLKICQKKSLYSYNKYYLPACAKYIKTLLRNEIFDLALQASFYDVSWQMALHVQSLELFVHFCSYVHCPHLFTINFDTYF